VSYSDLSNFVVGYAWQLICQVGSWLLFKKKTEAAWEKLLLLYRR
ncbi:MAG: hypothetical protein QG618_164, partial [Thermodesulfobacteriota bacterium]|nr:hypothetical protein [Thermodesulfobacteriota bacterium]